MSRYRIEDLPNGMIRVFDQASKLTGCYHADGRYAFGDLHAPTICDLIGEQCSSVHCTASLRRCTRRLQRCGDQGDSMHLLMPAVGPCPREDRGS